MFDFSEECIEIKIFAFMIFGPNINRIKFPSQREARKRSGKYKERLSRDQVGIVALNIYIFNLKNFFEKIEFNSIVLKHFKIQIKKNFLKLYL